MISEGFPGRPVVKNLLANAGDMGLISGLGRSHSRRATAVLQLLKPSSLEPVLCNRISHRDEKTKHSDEE